MKKSSIKASQVATDAWREISSDLKSSLDKIVSRADADKHREITVRWMIRGIENKARVAVKQSFALLPDGASWFPRVNLHSIHREQADAVQAMVETRLSAAGLWNASSAVLLKEALGRALQPPPRKRPGYEASLKTRLGKAAAYIAHNVVLVLITAVVGGVVTAIALKVLKLD